MLENNKYNETEGIGQIKGIRNTRENSFGLKFKIGKGSSYENIWKRKSILAEITEDLL